MIDLLLKALDKAIELAKRREDIKDRELDKVFVPLYADIERIHCDYLKSFNAVHDAVKLTNAEERRYRSGGLEVEKVWDAQAKYADQLRSSIELLHNCRTQYEPLRMKCQLLGRAMIRQNSRNPEQRFIAAVVDYFPSVLPATELGQTEIVAQTVFRQTILTEYTTVLATFDTLEHAVFRSLLIDSPDVWKFFVEARDVISLAINRRKLKWHNVSEAYAEVRASRN